jgi:hypothetical protein
MLQGTENGIDVGHSLMAHENVAKRCQAFLFWLHLGRDADGSDRSLLHAQPFCPLEIWPGSRSPVIATPPDLTSPLKVLRAP